MEQIKCYFGIDDFSRLQDSIFLHYFIATCDEIVSSKEKLCYISTLYNYDENGQSIYNFLDTHTSSEQKYVQNVLNKLTHCIEDKTQLVHILNSTNYDNPNCAFGHLPSIQQEFNHLFISESFDLNTIRIELLRSKPNFDDLYYDLQKCFVNLYFNQEFFFKEYEKSDIVELILALSVLNSEGMKTYIECNKDAGEALKKLSTKLSTKTGKQTACSGSSDPKKYKKTINIDENEYEINVSPHIKLNNSYSNKRIYFAWGNERIANGRIIVYIINGHI